MMELRHLLKKNETKIIISSIEKINVSERINVTLRLVYYITNEECVYQQYNIDSFYLTVLNKLNYLHEYCLEIILYHLASKKIEY